MSGLFPRLLRIHQWIYQQQWPIRAVPEADGTPHRRRRTASHILTSVVISANATAPS